MIKKLFLLALLVVAQFQVFAQKKQPNIIVILADDLGFSDIGAFGSEIETPNLNKLAKNGLILKQFYNAGRCCPSRASLLTGLYSHQAGVGDMVQDKGVPAYQGYLNEHCITIGHISCINEPWANGPEVLLALTKIKVRRLRCKLQCTV